MVIKASLMRRIRAAEDQLIDVTAAPDGALPAILAEDELHGAAAEDLRRQGYSVMTFKQAVEAML